MKKRFLTKIFGESLMLSKVVLKSRICIFLKYRTLKRITLDNIFLLIRTFHWLYIRRRFCSNVSDVSFSLCKFMKLF
jgi:hypothetical protein